ncbi:hypothetical protein FRAAL1183 [Frankia alni ACN14a]|uniref:PIN domain-containing protein n=1 Tax=Frankia alni (strain DSM 45986 / CECT 9034 / ACN14a) TaxID=326424 RepID=Q0RRH4_FRAAA|nr:hypothetical protein FRAAL1183 [Frankia alni ACN14a]
MLELSCIGPPDRLAADRGPGQPGPQPALGTVDASVIACAERLGVDEVATVDRRHFTVVKASRTLILLS